jgi:BASS family bile acid:Na+ symporter
MTRSQPAVVKIAEYIHRNLLWFLVAAYAFAAVLPTAGLWIQGTSLGQFNFVHETTRFTLPAVLLSILLLNAGLGLGLGQMRHLLHQPAALWIGLMGNLLIPIVFILGVSRVMRIWHNPVEIQYILVGLALIASMPIAGSSTAWSQNADGDMALSLGLIVLSNFFSPLTTPAVLHGVGWIASGIYANSLHELAAGGSGLFLSLFVLLPSAVGIGIRSVLLATTGDRLKPGLKLLNSLTLLVLMYSNAAVTLPQVVARPDWDFLAVMFAIVSLLCAVAFGTGWLIARLLRANRGQYASLIFGLGMSNNGMGMVLASTALSYLPNVMLPIIFYNLVQHLVAGLADRFVLRSDSGKRRQA